MKDMKDMKDLKRKIAALLGVAVLSGAFAEGMREDETAPAAPEAKTVETVETVQTVQTVQKIVIIVPDLENPLFRAEAEAAEAHSRALGYDTGVYLHGGDVVQEARWVDQAIAEQAAAILLDCAGEDASVGAVQKARDAGLPAFLIRQGINKAGVATAQVLSNNNQGIREAAECFAALLGETGEYAEFLPAPAAGDEAAAEARSKRRREVLDRRPALKQAAREIFPGTEAGAQARQARMAAVFQKHPRLKGVICGSDALALDALTVLRAAGRDKVIVVGFDGTNQARDSILAGGLKATCLQRVPRIAVLAVDMADQYLKTGSFGHPEKQLLDCVLITGENAGKLDNFILGQ